MAFQGRTLERDECPITNYQCPMPNAHSLQKYAKCAKIVPNNGDYSSIIWNNLAFFLI
jgi:hypothetical protein